jgi:hypothetical protein
MTRRHAKITRKSDNQDRVSIPYKSNEKKKKGESEKNGKREREE